MARRRRSRRSRRVTLGRFLGWLAALPVAYLAAALIGALLPVNRGWIEPDAGTTVYIASNGAHTDLVLPAVAQGLDWRPLLPRGDVASLPPRVRWIAFGTGERRVYLDTPRWRDIRPGTLWAALTGGERVMHVEWVANPTWHARAIRLRPEEYRRLWAAIRAGFALDGRGRPQRIAHPGYGHADAFYRGAGRASAIDTCNNWTASRLRLAGVRTSLWSPFAQGLTWRYPSIRRFDGLTGYSG